MPEGRLQRELKKRRPFETPEQEALLNLFRTTDQFQIRMTRFFRQYGLTPSQYNVLRILAVKENRCRAWRSPTGSSRSYRRSPG